MIGQSRFVLCDERTRALSLLEERMRGSSPNTAEEAVHSIRFYSKDLHEYNPYFYSKRNVRGERGNE